MTKRLDGRRASSLSIHMPCERNGMGDRAQRPSAFAPAFKLQDRTGSKSTPIIAFLDAKFDAQHVRNPGIARSEDAVVPGAAQEDIEIMQHATAESIPRFAAERHVKRTVRDGRHNVLGQALVGSVASIAEFDAMLEHRTRQGIRQGLARAPRSARVDMIETQSPFRHPGPSLPSLLYAPERERGVATPLYPVERVEQRLALVKDI